MTHASSISRGELRRASVAVRLAVVHRSLWREGTILRQILGSKIFSEDKATTNRCQVAEAQNVVDGTVSLEIQTASVDCKEIEDKHVAAPGAKATTATREAKESEL